ncbi:MAG: OmpH family outer membrane protein [Myxococcota bacterium]|nr:OmpH family outer membrane protein [Myxococcota bacterium]
MHVRRHAVTLAVALLLAAVAPRLYAQATRVAVVDLQRALTETEDGRRAKARLKRTFEARQRTLDAKQRELKALQEEIEAQQKVLSPEALQKRVEAFQKAYMELQSTYMEYQRELASKEAELTQPILSRMQEIVQRIGQSEGYTLILERNESGVIWVPANLDLTDMVIQQYNASSSEGSSRRGRRSSKRR